jgi:TonB-dependent SusC/RagA subfamily outer membrane receptor
MKTRTIVTILAFLLAAGHADGQKRGRLITVTGTVTDTLMVPVAGVMIIADGQETGVVTGRNGTYKVRIRPDISSLGAYKSNMGSVITKYDGTDRVDFFLDGTVGMPGFNPKARDEGETIEIGYGKAKKKNLTTDVGYVDAQDEANSSYTNIYDMIQGKVPGVQVTGNKITIRGINSINLSTDPLFVVDGVVVNSLDNISPRQVKSISVLKGADASIYGSRGAGGVILITLLGSGR